MKLMIMTSSFPRGPGEAFLIPELEEMRRRGIELTIIPVNPRGAMAHREAFSFAEYSLAVGLFSWRILASALLETFARPIPVFAALGVLLSADCPARTRLKNIVAFPKALWVSREARRRGIEHIHAYWLSVSSSVALLAARLTGIPWSATAYRWDIAEGNMPRAKARSAAFLRVADRAGTQELRAKVGPDSCPIATLHSGAIVELIDLGKWESEARAIGIETKEAAGKPVIVVPAMFVPKKGHSYLVEAIALLSERGLHATAHLVGEGPLMGEIKDLVRARKLEASIRFVGAVPHSCLLGIMSPSSCDVVVLPSIVTEDGEKEGIPMSLIEAMAVGTPVVGTDCGGITELLDSECGIVVGQRDPLALANAIAWVLEDPERARAMVARARARIRQDYSVEAVVDRLGALMSAPPSLAPAGGAIDA